MLKAIGQVMYLAPTLALLVAFFIDLMKLQPIDNTDKEYRLRTSISAFLAGLIVVLIIVLYFTLAGYLTYTM